MAAKDLKHLLGRWVQCSAPGHNENDMYTLFEINEERNGAKIQKPDDFHAHWVNARFIRAADPMLGYWVHCSAQGHDENDMYVLLEINEEKNGVKIQKPDVFNANCVNARFIQEADPIKR